MTATTATTTANGTIRVVIVDDEPLLREGVATALATDPAFEVVGEAATAAEAEDVIRNMSPDVAIIDYRLPGANGAQLCETLQRQAPEIRRLVLTRHTSERIILEAFDAGAQGFLVKDTDPAGVRRAVLTVVAGEVFIDPSIGARVVKKALEAQRPRNPLGLTRQELRCLELVDRGLSNGAICERLEISPQTLKTHLKHAVRKLGADDRRTAVQIARREGLLSEDVR